MATRPVNYDPAQVQVSIGGAIITGYEAGTFIQLTRSVNSFDWSVGADGKEGVRAKRNDRSAMLTLTLRQTSLSNAILSNLANLDEASATGVVPVQVTELGTKTRYISAYGWIEKPADAGYGETPSGRAWQLRLTEVPFESMGNPSVAALTSTLA